jgi:hypothetical protein
MHGRMDSPFRLIARSCQPVLRAALRPRRGRVGLPQSQRLFSSKAAATQGNLSAQILDLRKGLGQARIGQPSRFSCILARQLQPCPSSRVASRDRLALPVRKKIGVDLGIEREVLAYFHWIYCRLRCARLQHFMQPARTVKKEKAAHGLLAGEE